MLPLITPLVAVAMTVSPSGRSPPSASRWLLDAALSSPLYKLLLVPQAKRTMEQTAESNGVPWRDALSWIRSQGPWALPEDGKDIDVPDYYRQPFHAYEQGNLCWNAAWEVEIASRAVGARNYPDHGADGENAFRGAFDEALASVGAACPRGGTIVDFGSGSGVSTRRLAARFPGAESVVGLDLSPHFLAVGERLMELAPDGGGASNRPWVNSIKPDERVQLRRADIAQTGLPDASADVVSLSLVIHELPPDATRDVCAEAFRILKPGGQLWVTEMDFDTQGFSELRANPVLFALIRSTEPYLDIYADYQTSGQFPADLAEIGFGQITLIAATGRHFACVATKGGAPSVDDRRAQTAKPDTHLKTWEAKRGSST